MIITEQLGNFINHYSDTGHYIRKIGTNEVYEEAVDPVGTNRQYEETEDLIPVEEAQPNEN